MLDQKSQARHLQEMEENGFTVIENVITKIELEALNKALLEVEEKTNAGYRDTDFEGRATVRDRLRGDPPPDPRR